MKAPYSQLLTLFCLYYTRMTQCHKVRANTWTPDPGKHDDAENPDNLTLSG